jgi:hypothetical protein
MTKMSKCSRNKTVNSSNYLSKNKDKTTTAQINKNRAYIKSRCNFHKTLKEALQAESK